MTTTKEYARDLTISQAQRNQPFGPVPWPDADVYASVDGRGPK